MYGASRSAYAQAKTREPVLRPLRGLSTAVRALIIASAAAYVITAGVEVSGILAIDGFQRGSAGIGALEAYEATSVPLALLAGAIQLAAGICWVVWQYRAATAMPVGSIRRTPGWHAGSWFIPVVAWWFPFQNVKDLVAASRASVGTGLLGLWWALWVAGNLSYPISNLLMNAAQTLPAISTAITISAFGDLLLLAGAPFAWLIVKRITDAIDPARR